MPETTQRRKTKDSNNGHLNILEMKEMKISSLTEIAKDLSVPGFTGMRKQELIFQILRAQTEQNGLIFSEGVLECLPEGFGFLRAPDYNYLPVIYSGSRKNPVINTCQIRNLLEIKDGKSKSELQWLSSSFISQNHDDNPSIKAATL